MSKKETTYTKVELFHSDHTTSRCWIPSEHARLGKQFFIDELGTVIIANVFKDSRLKRETIERQSQEKLYNI